MKTHRFFSAVVFALTPMCAFGDESPKPTPIEGRFDILGARTGQTLVQLREALAKLPDAEFQDGKLRDPTTGKDYISQPAMLAKHPDPANPKAFTSYDQVPALFSAPSSGNLSLVVKRTVHYYDENGPEYTTTIDSLERKYGKSPTVETTPDPHSRREVTYLFGADAKMLDKIRITSYCVLA